MQHAVNPNNHYFSAPLAFHFDQPQKDFPRGRWESINQESILQVSAIALLLRKLLTTKV
jgi:hypothetical protein